MTAGMFVTGLSYASLPHACACVWSNYPFWPIPCEARAIGDHPYCG